MKGLRERGLSFEWPGFELQMDSKLRAAIDVFWNFRNRFSMLGGTLWHGRRSHRPFREAEEEREERKRDGRGTKRKIDWARAYLSVSSFSSFSLCPCVLPPESSLTDVPDPAGDKDARHGWLELVEKEEEEEEERNGNNADGREKEEEIEILSTSIALFTLLQTKGASTTPLSLRHALASGFCPLWPRFLHTSAFFLVARHLTKQQKHLLNARKWRPTPPSRASPVPPRAWSRSSPRTRS